MPLKIKIAPKDTFHNWLKSKGKLGGQSKFQDFQINEK